MKLKNCMSQNTTYLFFFHVATTIGLNFSLGGLSATLISSEVSAIVVGLLTYSQRVSHHFGYANNSFFL